MLSSAYPTVQEARFSPPNVRRQRAAVVVADKPPQILRKADGALVMKTVSTVEPTFLQRKAFNVFLQVAQRPVNAECLVYEVGFKEFEELIGLSPNNRPHMRALVDRLTSVKVVFDYRGEGKKGSWGVANLLAEIYIDEDNRTIRYSFPVEMRQKLLDPAIYNRIDLSLQNRFSSYSALALYEIVSRYFTYAGKRTFAEHWTTWSVLLSGAREPHATYREFNKMMSRAIEQVNTHCTKHVIEMRVTKIGLKVDQIWFVIDERAQAQLPHLAAPALVSGELLTRSTAIGVDENELRGLLVKFNEEYLFAQLDYTERRIAKKGAEPVANPRAFFIGAVERNYADAPITEHRSAEAKRDNVRKINGPAPTAATQLSGVIAAARELWSSERVGAIMEELKSLEVDEQQELLERQAEAMSSASGAMWQSYRRRGKPTHGVLITLARVLMKQRNTEPSEADLLTMAIERGLLKMAA